MSYSKPEKICPGETPGYRKFLKKKAAKTQRRAAKRAEDGGRVKVAKRGWSV